MNKSLLRSSFPVNPPRDGRIVIAGGGLAAIFSAYKILSEAKIAGRGLDVTLISDRLNTPCAAGSHFLLMMEGMFHGHERNMAELSALLRRALGNLESVIRREKIDCRFRHGYEIKAQSETELKRMTDYMVARGLYAQKEFCENSNDQVLKFKGFDASVKLDAIGQVNMPELLTSLLDDFKAMGGVHLLDMRYMGQTRKEDGTYLIETDRGDLVSDMKPLIATGAEHQKTLPFFPFKADIAYTMGFVMGPLSAQDANIISPSPMAFCTSELDGDFIWGGLDEKNCFTIGRGDMPDNGDANRSRLLQELTDIVETRFTGLTDAYPPRVTFGAMLVPENKMPIVGRLPDYDVMGGWSGMGILAGYAAASAYARWIVYGNDDELKVYESLQDGFTGIKFSRQLQSDATIKPA